MPSTTLSCSPPVLQVPRQPSPLSFSSVSAGDPPSPPSFASYQPRPSSEVHAVPFALDRSSDVRHATPSSHTHTAVISPIQSTSPTRTDDYVPTAPVPDSLLVRSTFTALEHSAQNLKRLSKSILASSTYYLTLLDQLERAEDDLLACLGELGRWLEGGYGLQASCVWDDKDGIRNIKRRERKREKEEIEVMVEHGLLAVKADLKRNGLAGGGAQTRFDNTAKHFYSQTSSYLSPHAGPAPSSSNATSYLLNQTSSSLSQPSASRLSQNGRTASSDLAQACRSAQFDLARYNHHSTLLYAVPPSSIACLDLLVSLYTWVSGCLTETTSRCEGDDRRSRSSRISTTSGRDESNDRGSSSPTVELRSYPLFATSAVVSLKSSLSTSLAKLASRRADVLQGWSTRSRHTAALEVITAQRQAEWIASTGGEPGSLDPSVVDMASTPVSSGGLEHKRPRKIHKIQRSVGGKLRELLAPSSSSPNLAGLSSSSREAAARMRFDGFSRGDLTGVPVTRRMAEHPIMEKSATLSGRGSLQFVPSVDLSRSPILRSRRSYSANSPRPPFPSRHSVPVSRESGYTSPFFPDTTAMPTGYSPDLNLSTARISNLNGGTSNFGGIGGLGAGGDEDEMRGDAGRKKEGVLWGAGSWESLSKGSGKSKWEKFWVVLDRSSIFEYRDNGLGKPDPAHAVIDLKFASVREGRGTDRRFVFEVVTPTQGRRLYQATSEGEMKQWLYAICNAIESCINGTSSVRTFDTSKLRTVSGSLDDHALPTRRLFPGVSMSPGNRRSMPPIALRGDDGGRQRKTSLKKVLRQSAEIGGERWSNVVGKHGGLDLPRHQAPSTPSSSQPGSMKSPPGAVRHGTTREMDMEASASSRNSVSQIFIDNVDQALISSGPDNDIQQKVLEMAGLGVGHRPDSAGSKRHQSEGAGMLMGPEAWTQRSLSTERTPLQTTDHAGNNGLPGTCNSIHTVDDEEPVDMRMLRRIAELPANTRCADCGKGTKISRWATLCLRDVPMVLFLCIRCVGVHRSLGTHISKPRSVDLDIWSPESIISAKQWGNERCNAIWEKKKPPGVVASDGDAGEFIRHKYVDGRWLDNRGRRLFGLQAI